MKITLIVTGKTKRSWLIEAMNEYTVRLGHYIQFQILETNDIRNTRNMPEKEQMEREGAAAKKLIPGGSLLILLDDKGTHFTSESFAGFIQQRMNEGRDICMMTGGAYGFSEEIFSLADLKVSLSKMTFSHQMVRLILLEQLYRAFTIIRGEPYHHA